MDTCFAGEVETFDLAESAAAVSEGGTVRKRAFALGKQPTRRINSKAILRQQMFTDLHKSAGATVVTSSGGMEFVYALEDDSLKNGLFTHALLNNLRNLEADANGDGIITLSELFVPLTENLQRLSGGVQQPFLREVNRQANIPLVKCRAAPVFNTESFFADYGLLTSINNREDDHGPDSSMTIAFILVPN